MELKQVNIKDISVINPRNTLYILGNGFDRAHDVKSQYTHFRDSLGKHSHLRETLEMYITSDKLWSDFEEALAHIDTSAMYNTVDFWLDDFDAYDEDAQASQFYAAIDAATTPIYTIQTELPRRFRNWINSLKPLSNDKPFAKIIKPDSHFLVFNYTEFAESVYSVDADNICYIHGCRKDKNCELILGHSGTHEDEGELPLPKGQTSSDALNHISWRIADYYEDTRKHTRDIIKDHTDFFKSLADIETIVVIGHSLSVVDYDYFRAVIGGNSMPQNIRWYMSFHTPVDCARAETFVSKMGIDKNNVVLFATT